MSKRVKRQFQSKNSEEDFSNSSEEQSSSNSSNYVSSKKMTIKKQPQIHKHKKIKKEHKHRHHKRKYLSQESQISSGEERIKINHKIDLPKKRDSHDIQEQLSREQSDLISENQEISSQLSDQQEEQQEQDNISSISEVSSLNKHNKVKVKKEDSHYDQHNNIKIEAQHRSVHETRDIKNEGSKSHCQNCWRSSEYLFEVKQSLKNIEKLLLGYLGNENNQSQVQQSNLPMVKKQTVQRMSSTQEKKQLEIVRSILIEKTFVKDEQDRQQQRKSKLKKKKPEREEASRISID